MSRQWIVFAALVLALTAPRYVTAHPGHTHKVMGTVATVTDTQLEVKGTDGKMSTMSLNAKTVVLRGKTKASVADIKPGERIAATGLETKGKDGKTTIVATEVRLAEAVASKGR